MRTLLRERATLILVIAAIIVMPLTGVGAYRLLGMESWPIGMAAVITLVPYIGLGVINGAVLRLKGRSLHWLWFYLFWNWYGALIPAVVAIRSKPKAADSHQAVDDHVASLSS